MTVVVRLCDVGCIQNALPVAERLQADEIDVLVYRDPGSIAEERVVEGFKFIDEIPTDALIVSCLPLGVGFAAICKNKNPVVLIQENPDPADVRFDDWQGADLKVVATLAIPEGFSHLDFSVTGLPSIDHAAEETSKIDVEYIKSKIGLQVNQKVVVLSLPGDYNGAKRMLDLVEQGIAQTGHTVIARSHPKLKREDMHGYEVIKDRIDSMSPFSLEAMNLSLGPLESICLSVGFDNHFVGTHDTTMNWQAAAAGVTNIQVLPPMTEVMEWVEKSPIITTGFGRVFDGSFIKHQPNRSFVTNNAVFAIKELVVKHS